MHGSRGSVYNILIKIYANHKSYRAPYLPDTYKLIRLDFLSVEIHLYALLYLSISLFISLFLSRSCLPQLFYQLIYISPSVFHPIRFLILAFHCLLTQLAALRSNFDIRYGTRTYALSIIHANLRRIETALLSRVQSLISL